MGREEEELPEVAAEVEAGSAPGRPEEAAELAEEAEGPEGGKELREAGERADPHNYEDLEGRGNRPKKGVISGPLIVIIADRIRTLNQPKTFVAHRIAA